MSANERIKALKDAPPNGWIAFNGDETKVVGYGNTYDEVVSVAEESGVSDPLLVKVPKDWTATVMGG